MKDIRLVEIVSAENSEIYLMSSEGFVQEKRFKLFSHPKYAMHDHGPAPEIDLEMFDYSRLRATVAQNPSLPIIAVDGSASLNDTGIEGKLKGVLPSVSGSDRLLLDRSVADFAKTVNGYSIHSGDLYLVQLYLFS